MKRRDLLKGAGTLVLGAPAVRASALLKSNAEPAQSLIKDLVVAFAGPFCFWQGVPQGNCPDSPACTHCITVMAPPVGPNCPNRKIRHQPWVGTTANENAINVAPCTTLTLNLPGYTSPTGPAYSGTQRFDYPQGSGSGAAEPLFNLAVPIPDIIIGVRPTSVMMVCASGVPDNYCTEYCIYATGLSFVYKNVPLNGVSITNGSAPFFNPCFTNDAELKDATLGVHLTPLDRNPDLGHVHATQVWEQMLAMYPWMQKEITSIDFNPTFNPASCDQPQCITRSDMSNHKKDHKKAKSDHQTNLLIGPGNDCQVPIMNLPPPGPNNKRKR
jgi:hypothetical protein